MSTYDDHADRLGEECEYCGRWCDNTGIAKEWTVHHLWQRSIRPDLIKDPNNLMILCGKCHQFATDKRGFEIYLRETFYGRTRLSRKNGLANP